MNNVRKRVHKAIGTSGLKTFDVARAAPEFPSGLFSYISVSISGLKKKQSYVPASRGGKFCPFLICLTTKKRAYDLKDANRICGRYIYFFKGPAWCETLLSFDQTHKYDIIYYD
jgi:hypothetical protein